MDLSITNQWVPEEVLVNLMVSLPNHGQHRFQQPALMFLKKALSPAGHARLEQASDR
jgi:hypothetical protein